MSVLSLTLEIVLLKNVCWFALFLIFYLVKQLIEHALRCVLWELSLIVSHKDVSTFALE